MIKWPSPLTKQDAASAFALKLWNDSTTLCTDIVSNSNYWMQRLYWVCDINSCNDFTMCLYSKINYLSYKLFKVHNTDNVRQFIERLNMYELNGVDIMLINRNKTHALVSPDVQMNFDMLLQEMNATYSIDDNVQRFVFSFCWIVRRWELKKVKTLNVSECYNQNRWP